MQSQDLRGLLPIDMLALVAAVPCRPARARAPTPARSHDAGSLTRPPGLRRGSAAGGGSLCPPRPQTAGPGLAAGGSAAVFPKQRAGRAARPGHSTAAPPLRNPLTRLISFIGLRPPGRRPGRRPPRLRAPPSNAPNFGRGRDGSSHNGGLFVWHPLVPQQRWSTVYRSESAAGYIIAKPAL